MNLMLAKLWMPTLDDLRLFGPELTLVVIIALILLVPVALGRRPYLTATIAVFGALAGMLLTARGVGQDLASGPRGGLTPPGETPMLIADRFGVFFKLLLFLLLALITWLWMLGIEQRAAREGRGLAGVETTGRNATEFFVLLLTSALGMMLMVGSLNLLVIVIAMETASLPSYAIVASDKRSRVGAEAALKYVTFGAASAAIMLYGVSLLFGQFGTLDLGEMAAQIGRRPELVGAVFWLGMAALGAGIAFKIAAVPMHFWCPDVFEGAPVEVTTWLSIASKAAGLGLLLRIVAAFTATAPLADVTMPLLWGIGLIAAITCTLGNFAALRQESVKRTLAYSSIAHAGYMMMAAAIIFAPMGGGGDTAGVNTGVAAVVAYLFVYLAMNVGAFGATALVAWQTGSDHLSSFTGLGRRAPWLAVPMAVCLFSLIGLPPLGGFTAKWFLILALGRGAGVQPWLWVLVVVAVVNTAISLYYYVRIIRQMFLTDDPALPRWKPPGGGLVIVNACAVVLLLLGTVWFNDLGQRANVLAGDLYGQARTTRVSQR